MAKEKDYNYYVINIPIKGNHEENEELYKEFFMFLYQHRKPVEIKGEKAGIIRKCTQTDDGKSMFGYVSTFTKIGKNWIDIEKLEKEEVDIPKNKFPNLKESMFFFFPKFHRILILKTNDSASINLIMAYFIELKKSIRKYDFDVFLETSSNIIDEVLSADKVLTLKYNITYTNADTGTAAYEFLDNELKKSKTKSMEITVKSEKNEGIEINESEILKGATELSKEYGSFEATIIKEGKRKKIKTKDYPFTLKVKSNLSEINASINKMFANLSKHLGK